VRRSQHDVLEVVMDGHLVPASFPELTRITAAAIALFVSNHRPDGY
jgi:hypothetical protein